MTRAEAIVEHVVRCACHDGFGLLGVHVRIGGDTAQRLLGPDDRRDVHSVAKGVCVLAVGMAADDALLDVDEPVVRYLPSVRPGPGAEQVTMRQLLTMTSGIDLPWSPTLMTDWPDLAHEFLGRPTPGLRFQYSNASTYTAMRALAAVVGDVVDWLGPRLFEPLGIQEPTWDRCPHGFVVAGEGLHLRVDELARIGQLIRDGGRWQDQDLISSRWIRAMHTNWIERVADPMYNRYALAGWAGPGRAWRLHGAYGQLMIFQGDAVVTIAAADHTGADRMAQRVVDVLTSFAQVRST